MYAASLPIRGLLPGVVLLVAQHLAAAPVDDQYSVAAAHYTHGRWQLAADEFAAFLSQFPTDPRSTPVVFFLGEALVQLQRYAEAEERFAEYLKRAPQERYAEQARFRRGEAAFFQGEYRQAQEALEAFRAEHAQSRLNAYVLAYLGEIALSGGDGPRAEILYRQAIERYRQGPLEQQCRFGLAHALELQGDFDEAMRFYRFLVENDRGELADDAQLQIGSLLYRKGAYAAAVAALSGFDGSFPESPLRASARYWVGMSLLAAARYREAATALEAASQRAAETALAPAIEFSWGEALHKLGEAQSARSHFEKILKSWPESAWGDDALQVLAQAALETGALDEAIRLSRELADKHPDSPLRPAAAQTLGRALLKQEQYAEAVQVFEVLVTGDLGDGAAAVGSTSSEDASQRANRYYLVLALLGAGRAEAAWAMSETIHPAADEKELAAGLLVVRASCLIALTRFAEAIEPLRRYLMDWPQGAEAAACSARLVVALAESGDEDAARAACERFRQQFAGHELVLPTTEYLADRAAARQQWDVASQLYQLLADNQDSPDYAAKGLAGLGRTQLKTGSAEASAKTFETLLDRSPASPQAAEAAYLRARSLETSDRAAESLEAYREVLDRFPESPQVPHVLLASARLQERLGHTAEALTLLERFTEQHGDSAEMPTALYQMAWLLADGQRNAEADAAFRRIAAGYAGTRYWADAVYRLAERAVQARDQTAAKAWLDQLLAAEIDPDVRAHALYLQGKVAIDGQQWADALPPLQKLVSEFGGHPLKTPAEYWIAEALFRLERYEESLQDLAGLEQAALDPREPWTAMVPLRRAQIFAQQGRWDEAFELAGTISERFPEFRQQHEVDYLLGRCLSSQARFREAREAYERVIRADSGGRTETAAMAQWMTGETYFHQKNYDEAIRAYHRVVSLYAFPQWQAAALLQAAKCHELKGERQEAEQLYAQVTKDYPATKYAAAATQLLKGEKADGGNEESLLGARK